MSKSKETKLIVVWDKTAEQVICVYPNAEEANAVIRRLVSTRPHELDLVVGKLSFEEVDG